MFLASKYIVMIFLITLEICLGILLGQDFNKLIVPWKGFPDGSVIKNLPAKAGDVGLIPGSGRSLEEEMTIHSSILVWEIPWTEKPDGQQFMGSQKIRT